MEKERLRLGRACAGAVPMALLPVVAVNRVQHLAAGWANARLAGGLTSSL